MFQMMNEARIGVGLGATAIASAAYYAALNYAKQRPQGRKLSDKGKLAAADYFFRYELPKTQGLRWPLLNPNKTTIETEGDCFN